MIDIIIPTCKKYGDITDLLAEVALYSINCREFIPIYGLEYSAARNRNIGLNKSAADFVIMMDDDITDLYPGWDNDLIQELFRQPCVNIVSARLMKDENTPAPMMSNNYDFTQPFVFVKKVPTACIAFRRTNIRFDENFKGSGFEDDDFCLQMGGKIIIDNRVKVIHKNEMKNQQEYWQYNKEYFEKKWKRA